MFSSCRKYFSKKSSKLSLLSLFKPLYVTLVVLGLFPYCVNFKTKHKCVIKSKSIYLNSMNALSWVLIMSAFGGIHVQSMIHELVPSTDVMTVINYILEILFLIATCIVCYIGVYSHRYAIVNILNGIASAWVELPETQSHILENLRFQILFSLISLVILLITHVGINFTRSDGLWKMILVAISFLLPQMIQFLALTFYCVLIFMVVALLTKIEGAIKAFTDYKTSVVNFRAVVPTMISPQEYLRNIEPVYVKTFEIKREINNAFQGTILLTCMQFFHAIVSESHIIYHGLMVKRLLTVHQIINFSVWIAYQLMKVYALAYSGNLLNTVNCRIGQALHNIPPERRNMREFMEIQHFSSMMSYQACSLTVYGYFSLDASFLFKVLASATMYLIILVQFDKKN